jgi:hypothetical protein
METVKPTIPGHTPSILSFAYSFVLVGLGFALPLNLLPVERVPPGRALEILNLFSLVAWLGLAHFYFAYHGHGRALAKGVVPTWKYILIFAVSAVGLAGLWKLLGAPLFSALSWTYFISHMVKAEMFFSNQKDWRFFLQPLLSFSYFSAALLLPEHWVTPPFLFGGAALCCLPFAFARFRQNLKNPLFGSLVLISAFLVGEGLLWGRYRPWMTPEFRDGVYTIHVALASFFHYFKAYAHLHVRSPHPWRQVILVNVVVILLGVTTHFVIPDSPLQYVFGFQYFTFWVWQHQWMSDVFNFLKRPAASVTESAS